MGESQAGFLAARHIVNSDRSVRRETLHQAREGAWLLAGLAASVAVSLALACGEAPSARGQIVFGLDNRPQSPIGIDPPVPTGGNGAEDPFGQLVGLTSVGPSPSLAVGPYSDATVLVPGLTTPELHLDPPPGANYIDAFSGNAPPPLGNPIRLAFSVDRLTSGAPGTAVFEQFSRNQQPSDVFSSQAAFPDPLGLSLPAGLGFVGSLGSTPFGGNVLIIDESSLTLTTTGIPGEQLPPDVDAPPISDATHDNVDSLYFQPFDVTGDFLPDVNFYYSVNPDQPGLNPVFQSAADLYTTNADFGTQLFTPAFALGLDSLGPNTDDVDALLVWDQGDAGVWEPGVDTVLFSLGPGSASLELFGLSAGDVFISDTNGRFAIYETACGLGLTENCETDDLALAAAWAHDLPPSPANLDALGWAGILGDMDLSGFISRADVADFVLGLENPLGYFLTHHALPPSYAGDMDGDTYHDFDDIDLFVDVVELFDPQPAPVPEPQGLICVSIGWVVWVRCRRRSTMQGFPARDTSVPDTSVRDASVRSTPTRSCWANWG